MTLDFEIREVTAADVAPCEAILRSLPEWFGSEEAISHIVGDIQSLPTFVAASSEQILGFLTLWQHNVYTAEIHVMGVRKAFHRRGLGTALVARAEAACRIAGAEYLEVKTVGSSRADEHYARTRGFYLHCGFRPLEELHGIWEADPCLILIKRL